MLAGLSEVSPASVPGQAAEYELRSRGYSLVAVIFLNRKLERLNGQEDRSTSRRQVLPGEVKKKQTLLCQLLSLLVSELGCWQLEDLNSCHYVFQQAVLVNTYHEVEAQAG